MDCVPLKLEQDLTPMDEGNNENKINEPTRWRDDIKWIISFVDRVGACVAATWEEMEWNAQGKGITYKEFHFTGQGV